MIGGLNSLIPPKNNKGDDSKLPVEQALKQNIGGNFNPQQSGNFGTNINTPVPAEKVLTGNNLDQGGIPVKNENPAISQNQNLGISIPAIPNLNKPEDAFIIHQEQQVQQQPQRESQGAAILPRNIEPNFEEEPGAYHQRHHRRPVMSEAIFQIEVEKIKPNPFQPRKYFDEQALKDLANSIREHGILQPLVVSKIESDIDTGTMVEYQLVAGERRLRASKIAGLERVPVIIRQMGEKAENLEVAVIENLQRENLDSVETARAYARLSDEFGMTQREIAVRLGKSREVVANTLRLLSLPTEFQTALSKGQINESQARLLLAVENPVAQIQLFNDIISNNLTVREVRNKVKKIHLESQLDVLPAKPVSSQDVEMKSLENKLKEVLGTEVKIENKGESGKIVITFYSSEEIYGLIHKIDPHGLT